MAVSVLLGAAGQGMAGEPKRSGWYVGAGAGVNWASGMKLAGRNLDTLCYPDSDCRHVGGAPEGYRWFYDIDSDPGSGFEISVGRMFGNLRVELSASQRDNDIDEEFTGITHLDGSGIVPKDGNYESSATRSVDRSDDAHPVAQRLLRFPAAGEPHRALSRRWAGPFIRRSVRSVF